jgi:hypothetical protein
MASLTLEVVRADDLLVLRLEFLNLVLDPDESQRPRRLVRESTADDALMIVHLQPQHISEMCVTQLASGSISGIPDAGADRLPSFIAGESRLVFRLPRDVASLPLTLDALLDWDRFETVLALDEDTASFPAHVPSAPGPRQTAIEMPFRLILSPCRGAVWAHRRQQPVNGGRFELWTTRLNSLSETPVRAIWSPDLQAAIPNPFLMTLSATDRAEITRLSSDFGILAADQFTATLLVKPHYRPVPLGVEQLMLSALGGWLRVHSMFDFPTLGTLLQLLQGHESDTGGELFALREWSHLATMGRDQNVRKVQQGFLYPFGHRASLVTLSERRFAPAALPANERPAYLVQRSVVMPHEPQRVYSHRDTPFVSVRINTVATPPLDAHADDSAFVPSVGGKHFGFAVTATDHEGRLVEFAAPMVFIPANLTTSLDEVRRQFQAIGPFELFNQQVAFANTGAAAVADQPGPSTAKVTSIQFEHRAEAGVSAPFVPIMQTATVRLPAAELLLSGDRKSEGNKIEYHPSFVAGRETAGVFARILDRLKLDFPADKAGGIAAPGMALSGLSLQHGAVPNASELASGTFSGPLEELDGDLLGVIKLKDVIGAVAKAGDLPRLRTESTREQLVVTFDWEAKLTQPGPPAEILIVDATSALNLKGKLVRPLDGSAPISEVRGEMSSFALSFAKVLRVDFKFLRFHMITGQKPRFDIEIGDFNFEGDLAFLKPLAAQLKKISDGFGPASGPAIAITPSGITATLTLSLPSVSLGILNLQNVAVSAGVALFFAGRPAELTFGLSRPESPFLISYSVFGGGGFFKLSIKTGTLAAGDSRLGIEASLEFGAVVAVDLVLARGVAQVMVGIGFILQNETLTLEGRLRIHGLLEVLRIVSISVDVQLKIHYTPATNTATAAGQLLVQVRVLAFSQSVSLTVERSFSTEHDPKPHHRRLIDSLGESQWDEYCGSFA